MASFFAKATVAPKAALPKWQWLPTVLGVGFTIMALVHLAKFEDFVAALETYKLFDENGTIALAILIALLEVLALPVLFKLRISPLMRALSVVALILLPLVWLCAALWAWGSGLHVHNAGLLSDLIVYPLNWLVIAKLFVMLGLACASVFILGGAKLLRAK